MDRDSFAKATRLGRQAGQPLGAALDGGDWDPSAPARLLDHLVRSAGGVPSFAQVMSILDSPLLTRTSREAVCDEIEGTSPAGGVLDLILSRAAERAVFAGESPRDASVRFVTSVV